MKTTRSSSVIDDDKPKTAVEAILPWRRNSSFGNTIDPDKSNMIPSDMTDKSGCASAFKGSLPEDHDDEQQAVKQQEFPPWIGNKEYLPNSYASPTNTLLEALDRHRSRESQNKILPVFEIFAGANSSHSDSNNEDDSGSSYTKTKPLTKPPNQSSSSLSPNSRTYPRSHFQDEESNIKSASRGSSSTEDLDMKEIRSQKPSRNNQPSSPSKKGIMTPSSRRDSSSKMSSSPLTSCVFSVRPSSRQEAVTAINPAFLPDSDQDDHDSRDPVTKL
jgi:hypothetical protein